MAGMDWFRWHHGAVTDPKFQLVARKSGASLPDVLAVWAYILETASQSVERGDFGSVDCEALDCLFGFPATETRTANIIEAMTSRGLLEGTRIAAWDKRQPKREREDTTNSDRQKTFRAKRSQVTPSNATENQKTPREEKSREEYSVPIGTGGKPPMQPDEIIFGYGLALLTNAGTAEKQARSFLGGLRKQHGDPALIDSLRECARAKPLQPLEWLAAALPPHGGKPKANSQEALEAQNRAVAERFLAKDTINAAH